MRRWIATIAVVVAGSGVASAQDTIAIIGPTKFTIPQQPPAGGAIRIPIRRHPSKPLPKPDLQTRRVQRQDTLLSISAFTATLDLGDNRPTSPQELILAYDEAATATPGEYVVTVEALADTGSIRLSQTITLTFVRLGAVLKTAPVHRVTHTLLPLLTGWTSDNPQELLVRERSNRTAFVPRQRTATADLVDGLGHANGRIELTIPTIRPGQQADVGIAIHQRNLGVSTAIVDVPSATVNGDTTTITVEVRTRIGIWFIVLVVLVGLIGGYQVRTRLEGQRLSARAERDVARELIALEQALLVTVDPAARDELRRELDNLQSHDRTADPATITQLAKTSEQNRTRILKDLTIKLDEQRHALASWRASLGTPSAQMPSIAAELTKLDASLDTVEQMIAGGNATGSGAFFADAENRLARPLRARLDTWSGELAEQLTRIGPWPDTALDAAIQRITTDRGALDPLIVGMTTAETVRAALRQAELMAIRVRSQILPFRDVIRLADDAIERLTKLEPDDPAKKRTIAAAIESLRAAKDKLLASLSVDPATADLNDDLVEAVRSVRQSLAAATNVAAVLIGSKAEADIRSSVDAGAFAKAFDQLVGPPLVAFDAESMSVASDEPTSDHPVALMLSTPMSLTVGVEAEFKATIVGASDKDSDITVQWKVDGQVVLPDARDRLLLKHTSAHIGMLPISVQIARASNGLAASAVRTLVVFPAPRDQLAIETDREKKITRIQTFVTSTFILIAGTAIFYPLELSWFQAVFLPLLWGFTTDVGVARVIELAGPSKSLAIPIPAK